MLVRKNRTAEAYKLLKDIDSKQLIENEEFVRSKYCLLKRIQRYEGPLSSIGAYRNKNKHK